MPARWVAADTSLDWAATAGLVTDNTGSVTVTAVPRPSPSLWALTWPP